MLWQRNNLGSFRWQKRRAERADCMRAVSGERFKNAANRLQLWMWLRCVW